MTESTTAGERICGYRTAASVALDRVATAAGLAAERLAQIESGVEEPTPEEVISLALVLGVAANDLRPGTTAPMVFADGLTTDEKIALILGDGTKE